MKTGRQLRIEFKVTEDLYTEDDAGVRSKLDSRFLPQYSGEASITNEALANFGTDKQAIEFVFNNPELISPVFHPTM